MATVAPASVGPATWLKNGFDDSAAGAVLALRNRSLGEPEPADSSNST
jgi:hypothetical protein